MHILLISLGPTKAHEPLQCYSTAVLAAAFQKTGVDRRCTLLHLEQFSAKVMVKPFDVSISQVNLDTVDAVGISTSIWNCRQVKSLCAYIKRESSLPIILGGPMIQGALPKLVQEFPAADHFVIGEGEGAMRNLEQILAREAPSIYKSDCISPHSSPYLDGLIKLPKPGMTIRTETQRGCSFRCNFCQHRNASRNQIGQIGNEHQWQEELQLFKENEVRKINIIDPYFNFRNHAQKYLSLVIPMELTANVALQIRPEVLIRQQDFLTTASQAKATLEVGIQTLDPQVLKMINRGSSEMAALRGLDAGLSAGTDIEVTLIYGLPGQSLASFENTIRQLRSCGVQKISAFPLQILPNTPLATEHLKLGMRTEIDSWDIPTVVYSPWFGKEEYEQMRVIASGLDGHAADKHLADCAGWKTPSTPSDSITNVAN